jgi:hypothetical protein
MLYARCESLTRFGLVFLALTLVLVGCKDDPLAPFQPEVLNTVDSFEMQATELSQVSTSLSYGWENTGTTANVNQATVLSAGNATLVLRDAMGTTVYTKDLTENGTFVTAAGEPGTWTVLVQLSACSGTLNFRSEKP